MGELIPAQRSAAYSLVASVLSPRGWEKVQQIIEADETLKANERNNPMFGEDLYYLSILGKPSEKDVWMLQFGGHHLALKHYHRWRSRHSLAYPDWRLALSLQGQRQDSSPSWPGERQSGCAAELA